MVRIFFGNRAYALLILPFVIAGYVALNEYMQYHLPEGQSNFGFWGNVLDQGDWIPRIAASMLVFVGAIVINTVFNRNEFMDRNNYLPALLYISCMSFFHSFYYLNGFSIAQLLIIFGFSMLLRLNQNEDGRRNVFNAAFLIGVASTFYPLLLLFIPFVLWMIWVIRPFVFRESMLTLVGFTIPLTYAGVYTSVVGVKLSNAQLSSSALELHLYDVIVLGGGALILLVLSIGPLLTKVQQSSIRLKKLFRIVWIMINFSLLLSIFEYFLFNKKEQLAMTFIPLMFLLPYGFGDKQQRMVTTTFYYILLFYSVGKFFEPWRLLTG